MKRLFLSVLSEVVVDEYEKMCFHNLYNWGMSMIFDESRL